MLEVIAHGDLSVLLKNAKSYCNIHENGSTRFPRQNDDGLVQKKLLIMY